MNAIRRIRDKLPMRFLTDYRILSREFLAPPASLWAEMAGKPKTAPTATRLLVLQRISAETDCDGLERRSF